MKISDSFRLFFFGTLIFYGQLFKRSTVLDLLNDSLCMKIKDQFEKMKVGSVNTSFMDIRLMKFC